MNLINWDDEASVRRELAYCKKVLEEITESFYKVKEYVTKGLLGERTDEARAVMFEASAGMNSLRKDIDALTRQLRRLTAGKKANWQRLGF